MHTFRFMLMAILAVTALQSSTAQLDGALKKAKSAASSVKIGKDGVSISQDEAGKGLKEALENGVGEAVSFLSAQDGYYKSAYKILLPAEANKVVAKLKNIPGFANLEADLIERMNRAAEEAAKKAKPIFVSAITSMTFQDALNILMGEKDAATRYLDKATHAQLFNEFKPVIQEALDKVNARSLWKEAVTAYNKIPLVTKTNPELDTHVTEMALKGMFDLVQVKEEKLRSDVQSRTSPLLQKVFAQQDKK